jgi:hypothetical protein
MTHYFSTSWPSMRYGISKKCLETGKAWELQLHLF